MKYKFNSSLYLQLQNRKHSGLGGFYVFPRSLGSIFYLQTSPKSISGIQTFCCGCGPSFMEGKLLFWK